MAPRRAHVTNRADLPRPSTFLSPTLASIWALTTKASQAVLPRRNELNLVATTDDVVGLRDARARGALVDERHDGGTPLMCAAKNRRTGVDALAELVESAADIEAERTAQKHTEQSPSSPTATCSVCPRSPAARPEARSPVRRSPRRGSRRAAGAPSRGSGTWSSTTTSASADAPRPPQRTVQVDCSENCHEMRFLQTVLQRPPVAGHAATP